MHRATARPVLRPVSVAIVAAIVYAVVLGGTSFGELQPAIRLSSAVFGGALLVAYVLGAHRGDATDRGVILAVLAFTFACLLSSFPRQSLDAAVTAVAYAAALFLARGVLGTPHGRSAALTTLMVLSATIAFVMAARWLPLIGQWWSLTGWQVLPPLDMNLDATPWGHRHDAALLLVILYPSWFVTRPGAARAAAATVVGALTLVVVIFDGSRTVWLAVAAALALAAAPRALAAFRRGGRSVALAVLAVAVLAVAVVAATGLIGTGVDRAITVSTLGARTSMWSALVDLWAAHPLAGVGPGAFPWALQLTSYFDANAWAPRHPDSSLFQLLAEAGLLGLLAAGVLARAIVPPVVRSGSTPAIFAVAAFVVAGVGASPTDFGFLVSVVIVWVALAAPRTEPSHTPAPSRRWPAVASLGSLALIATASGSILIAGFSYATARTLIHSGELARSSDALDVAIALDPGMALYVRQRGTLGLVEGDQDAAIRDLTRATELNPVDDLAWRTLSLARSADGDDAGAARALDRAVAVQRSDPTNLLLRAQLRSAMGDRSDAVAALAEVVQSWPLIVGAPGWDDALPDGITTSDVLDAAIERWEAGLGSPRPFENQAVILAALAHRPDLVPDAIHLATLSAQLTRAGFAVYSCGADGAAALQAASEGDRRVPQFWRLSVIQAVQAGAPSSAPRRLFEIMAGTTLSPEAAEARLNPVNENSGPTFSPDGWGYRRLPIAWPPYAPLLPSPWAGEARWLETGGCG